VIEGVPAGEHEVEALFAGAAPWRATVRVDAGEAAGVWPKMTFVELCECVVTFAPLEPVSRTVYRARVVEDERWASACCRAWRVRRDVPLARGGSR
jgi:hypothetical protein